MFTNNKLLKSKRFLPLLLTQFLGAFNDNVFKNALVILVTYGALVSSESSIQMIVAMAGGIFILPFFLFSGIAGQLADKHNKARLIRLIKIIEIGVMAIGAVGFYLNNLTLLLFTLFLMGSQSALFGPLKYSILPEHLKEGELIEGNGLIEATTFIAILLGTVLGGLFIMGQGGVWIISALVLLIAIVGWYMSLSIPDTKAVAPDLKINPNIFKSSLQIVQCAKNNEDVFLAILGISWLWFLGAGYLNLFPVFTKDFIGGNQHVATMFLVMFTVGIAIGSLLCNKLLHGAVQATYVPIGALGMAFFGIDLYFTSGNLLTTSETLIGLTEFFQSWRNWHLLFDMLMIAICGGIYIVPLYTILQIRAKREERSQIIAANNILNALFMVASAVIILILTHSGLSVLGIFFFIALFNTIAAFMIMRLLPGKILKSIGQTIFTFFFKTSIKGVQNLEKVGDQAIIIANHTSFLDGALLACFLPGKPVFAINTHIAEQWWLKFFLPFVRTFALDPTNPMGVKSLVQEVKKGNQVVIFPEGRITTTGGLMKIYEGPGMLADKAQAPVVPIRIDGAQYSYFSRLKGKVRRKLFPKITISIMEPRNFCVNDQYSGRERRKMISDKLYTLMTEMVFMSAEYDKTLVESIFDAKKIHGGGHEIAEDIMRKPLTYRSFILKMFILSLILRKKTQTGENVGVLLPTSATASVTFFSLLLIGRVPTMLNFSAGSYNIKSACKTAQVKTVYTARVFVKKAGLEHVVDALSQDNVDVVFLEDLAKTITLYHKIKGAMLSLIGRWYYKRITDQDPNNPCVILFTSGSEGHPKGVMLSHRNIQSNCQQLSSLVDIGPSDIVFNALPVFHSFGLTGGMLLPIITGVKAFYYPSPLHYRVVPELIYDTNATIMFGTDTFLAGYAKNANAYDFYNIRYVFAGAEKVKEETRSVYAEKFGIRLFEGYGATELSPVISTNTPMHNKNGSVGQLMPGMKYRIEDVPGIEIGGKLIVNGPNVMLGYLFADNPGVLVSPKDNWYDTGDIVTIDEKGYITIVGRAKRFAKIGGEMISLGAVENMVIELWAGESHGAVSIPDSSKGEQVVLLTTKKEGTTKEILSFAREKGYTELQVPKKIIHLEELPVLGTGKTDYVTMQKIALGEI